MPSDPKPPAAAPRPDEQDAPTTMEEAREEAIAWFKLPCPGGGGRGGHVGEADAPVARGACHMCVIEILVALMMRPAARAAPLPPTPDVLRSLPPEELAKVRPLSEDEIREALAEGARRRRAALNHPPPTIGGRFYGVGASGVGGGAGPDVRGLQGSEGDPAGRGGSPPATAQGPLRSVLPGPGVGDDGGAPVATEGRAGDGRVSAPLPGAPRCTCAKGNGAPLEKHAAWCPAAVPGAEGEATPDLSTQHQPKETIMDSRGHVHMYEDTAPTAAPSADRFRHTGFVSKDPMPERCDARKVLAALDKIGARPATDPPPTDRDAALFPLSPFDQGYVLGLLAEYRSWLANR